MNEKFEAPSCDDSRLRQIWLSVYLLPTINAADELGLFPLLEKGPLTVEDIAARLSITLRGAEAMVATLASAELLASLHGKFALTEQSRSFLLPDRPFYWGHMLRMFSQIPVTHEGMMMALRKDEPSVILDDKVVTDRWGAADVPPEQAVILTRAMHSHAFMVAMGLARVIDLSGVNNLLDVAGGSGCCAIAMAQRHPQVHFTVADLPTVCEITKQYIVEYGMGDRVSTMAMDMFTDQWPSGHEAIFFSNIMHDWEHARRHFLLRRSFEALPPGGRILIHEMLLSDALDASLTAGLFSINMVYLTLGKQFTAREISGELREGGFEDVAITPGSAGYSLVSARKPG